MRIVTSIVLTLVLAALVSACGGSGGGGSPPNTQSPPPASPPPPPPPPPPLSAACTGADVFPGFLYGPESAPGGAHMASSDGCQSQVIGIPSSLSAVAMSLTDDGSKGVAIWGDGTIEDFIVRRLDFTIDSTGNLVAGVPVTILPLTGEAPTPGEYEYFFHMDVWGDATHDALYLAVRRQRETSSSPYETTADKILIYDLNELTDVAANPDVRVLYDLENGGWQDAAGVDCSVVAFPQFAPTCYSPGGLAFNPSGTRLYIVDNIDDQADTRWDAALRVRIDRTGGADLADWTINGPELVYTGQDGDGLSGIVARPDNDLSLLPSPEYLAVHERSGGADTERASIINVDQCVADYAPYSDGTSAAPDDLWQGCLDSTNFFTGDIPGSADSWQSPDAILKSSFQDPDYNINRVYVSGALAGTEQLVIEGGRFADSGY